MGGYWCEKSTGNSSCVSDSRCCDDRSCDLTCAPGFTLDPFDCLCVCKRTCPAGSTLNTATCSCVLGGGSTYCEDVSDLSPTECSKINGFWCPAGANGIDHCATDLMCCNSNPPLEGGDTCNKTCGSGYTLDKASCSCNCTRTCGSGYKLNKNSCQCEKLPCTNKPSTIPCGQTWDENSCSLKGTAKTCPSGYSLNQSTCTCEKIPCTNKPSTIPCGQTWDDSTCSLKGTAKTCPSGYSLDSSCNCKCTRTCGSGYSLDSSSCSCIKNACTNKPSTIPCGQTWDESTCSLKGTAKTCPSGYSLNKSTCNCDKNVCSNKPSTIPCGQTWDDNTCSLKGSVKTCPSGYSLNQSTCNCDKNACTNKPSTIPCGQTWDDNTCSLKGTAKTCPSGYELNSSSCECEKLPCTNKPSTIPCGQTWNEDTCSLSGTAKTCPSGQHVNSSCNCVQDCPSAAELTLCNLCDNETGVVTKNMAINRTCSDETYEWSEEQCKCVISPRTLPRKGLNFCKLFERHANIMGNSEVCSGSSISSGTTNFADKKPDISLRNGLLIYNMHSDASELPILANNTQGGTYEGVPNTNTYGYTVYVDIDGAKGDSQLWSDVYPFYITLSGKIIPGYDSANPGISGGDSSRHLLVSIQYEDYSSGKRRLKWLAKSVPFKEGACQSGYIGDATPYCKNNTPITKLSECTDDGNSMCHLKHIQPIRFFF